MANLFQNLFTRETVYTEFSIESTMTTSDRMNPEREGVYLEAARKAIAAASRIQMENFGRTVDIRTKATTIDLVTNIDQESDEAITKILRQFCPESLILSEEAFLETDAIDLTNTWVIDPIDGTTNYAHGFPHWAISIAYFENNRPEIGLVYDPFKKELFYALRGRGAFLNDVAIFVSKTQHLDHALLATGFPYDIVNANTNNLDHFKRILPKCHGVRRPGAASLDLVYTACGRLDGFWELKLSPWDVAAGGLIVEEAGGKISDLHGNPLSYGQRRIDIVGSNNTPIHDELVQLLHGEPVISP